MNQISKPFFVMFALAIFTLALMFYSYRKHIVEPLDKEQAERAAAEVQATK
ncbi:hypothetical protein [Bdellovibrio sp. HCB337]|uniref:hypothetical protein n=1 Tax=Bdellovibrio sp. HCB337 TaxID=3394358 RepID=UPI0039A7543D